LLIFGLFDELVNGGAFVDGGDDGLREVPGIFHGEVYLMLCRKSEGNDDNNGYW
jgi:hypothetical protein